jgi:hypothetical protein
LCNAYATVGPAGCLPQQAAYIRLLYFFKKGLSMSRRNAVLVIVAGMMFLVAPNALQADLVWDVYDDYAITQASDNGPGHVWQFFEVAEGANTGYTWMDSFGGNYYGYDMLTLSTLGTYPSIGKSTAMGGMGVNPGDGGAAVAIGWQSPIAGTANVDDSFAIYQQQAGNGVTYALFEEGGTSPLESGILAGGANSGTITGTASIASGKMLYLQLGPNYHGGGTDYYSDYSAVVFNVSHVPEPGALVLLSTSVLGLLAYAWRKRG